MVTFQHGIFAGLAAGYCLFLGCFALFHGRSRRNLLFAGYNFCNASWNVGDVIYLLDKGTGAYEWILQITGIGGCFLGPMFIHFGWEVAGIAERDRQRTIVRALYILGTVFAVMHQTSLLHTTALNDYTDAHGYWSQPGPLFPVFLLTVVSAPLFVAIPISKLKKNAVGLRRKQITYLQLASLIGFCAVGVFALSFLGLDWPWAYYGLQSAVSFVFAYTIFQHDLIQVNVAIRRAALLIGIYVLLGLLAAPFAVFFYNRIAQTSQLTMSSFFTMLFSFGCIVSIAPVIYSALVRRSQFFQEQAIWNFTHELKTPIATIQSARAFLEDSSSANAGDEKLRTYINMIDQNAARLEHFVQSILEFGKANRHVTAESETEIDIERVLKEAIDQFPVARHRIRFDSSCSGRIRGYEEGIRQTVMNVLSNAVKYSADGMILIHATRRREALEICVQDNGKGIEPKNLTRIFEPFRSISGSNGRSKSTGLGLAIAKGWIEAHGGRIWAESEGAGKGTRVIFTLPLNS